MGPALPACICALLQRIAEGLETPTSLVMLCELAGRPVKAEHYLPCRHGRRLTEQHYEQALLKHQETVGQRVNSITDLDINSTSTYLSHSVQCSQTQAC